jgi:hypothetical protein
MTKEEYNQQLIIQAQKLKEAFGGISAALLMRRLKITFDKADEIIKLLK